MSVPSCSTLSLLYPSMPTQKAASVMVSPQLDADGSFQLAATLLKLLPVSA